MNVDDDAQALAQTFLALLRQAPSRERPASHEEDVLLPFLSDDLDEPQPACAPAALRPDDAALAIRLARALAPIAATVRGLRRDPLIVFEVPSPSDVAPLARILPRCLQPAGVQVITELGVSQADAVPAATPRLVMVTRATRARHPDATRLTTLLQARATVFAVAVTPEATLPRPLLRLADLRIRIPALDADAIAATIGAVTGTSPGTSVPPALAAGIGVDELGFALRADLDPDAVVARLAALAEPRAQGATVPRLSTLHGLGEVGSWGMTLAASLRAWRAGTLSWPEVTGGDAGLLIHGAPGTGKSMAVAALAVEADAHLIATSYATWQTAGDTHLGAVLKALRSDFDRARAHVRETGQAVILAIDEIDSLPARGSGGYADSWYTAINNCLLEELQSIPDGNGGRPREGVVTVGLCNAPTRIDPALRRPGRLGRVLEMPAHPGIDDLQGIVRFHVGADLLDEDLAPAAAAMIGQTGAEVAQTVGAARAAARAAGRDLTLDDLLRAAGADDLPVAYRFRIAVHEVGHALVALSTDPQARIDVVLGGRRAGGSTTLIDPEPRAMTRAEIRRRLMQLLGGREAEIVVLGAACAGSGGDVGSDLEQATNLALSAVGSFGLGESLIYAGAAGSAGLLHHPGARAAAEAELKAAQAAVRALLRPLRWALEAVGRELMARRRLDGDAIRKLMADIEARSPIPPHKRPLPRRGPLAALRGGGVSSDRPGTPRGPRA